jgi:hypothetical protein
MTQIALRGEKEVRNAHKKTKSFIFFEMLEEGQQFERLFFFVFSSRKQGSRYVQNILFAPHYTNLIYY